MSSLDSEQPSRGDSAVQRRKRKILACRTCRRHKLRCDRTKPACGRCKASGHTKLCTHDELDSDHSQRAVSIQTSSERDVGPNGHNGHDAWVAAAPATLVDPHYGTPPNNAFVQGDMDHDPRGSPSEALENRQTSSLWRGRGPGALKTKSKTAKDVGLAERPRPENPMLFRGTLFATQYSGATNPLSSIARVSQV